MKKINYLALGDSYTIGEGVGYYESFPYQLLESGYKNETIAKNLKIIAVTGWTTTDLLHAIKKAGIKSCTWDIVTLLIGVNNQYQNKTINLYKQEFTQLLNKAVSFANRIPAKVIVISIPDYSITPFAATMDPNVISKEIDSYNEIAFQISSNIGCQYVNITDISKIAGMDNAFLAQDGLHPSAEQYKLWVDRILPYFEKALTNE